MRNKNYDNEDKKILENELLNDIQRILMFIDISPLRFVIKESDSKFQCNCLIEISQSECQKKIANFLIPIINEKGKEQYINVWKFIQKKKKKIKYIAYKQIRFYSTNPQVFSMFRSFPYKSIKMFDLKIIEKFLWHMKFIICNGNDDYYSYFSKWLSFIFLASR